MVFLREEQLLLESLDLCLQLQLSAVGVIGDLSEPIDVTLRRLARGRLRLMLDSEVISSKTGVVYRTCRDPSPQVLDRLEVVNALVSDLGSLLL